MDCFDRQYDVMACPAFVACDGDEVVGAAPFAVEEAWNAIVLVMLNVLPDYQGRGGGRSLLDAVCEEAKERGLARVLVATTNDDLPALALYQRYGFRITEIVTGRVAERSWRRISPALPASLCATKSGSNTNYLHEVSEGNV